MSTFQKGSSALHYVSAPKWSDVLVTGPGLRDIGIRSPGSTIETTTDLEYLFPDNRQGCLAMAEAILSDAQNVANQLLNRHKETQPCHEATTAAS